MVRTLIKNRESSRKGHCIDNDGVASYVTKDTVINLIPDPFYNFSTQNDIFIDITMILVVCEDTLLTGISVCE